jgi:hypothetical protein
MFPESEQEELQDEMIDRLIPESNDAEHIGVIVYIHDLSTPACWLQTWSLRPKRKPLANASAIES